jgi:large subunit ribosomal protein L25
MKEATRITLEARETTGKEVARKLRREDYVPAVFYGPNLDSALPVKVKMEELAPVTRTTEWETTRLELTLPDGSAEEAIIKEVTKHPLTGDVLHVDFYQLVKGHKVTVHVPVELENRDICAGVKAGGILEFLEREVEISVLPREIPEKIHIDVAALELDQSVTVADLQFPESAEALTDPSVVVVMVAHARAEAEPEAEEEEREVEVVGKGKQADSEEE